MNERSTVADFIARGETPDDWKMVLVEQGPWTGPIELQLRRLQERLYQNIDAALDGKLAEKFPESKGKKIVVRLDGYNLPRNEVAEFFSRFSKGVLLIEDYQRALRNNQFVKNISFELNFESIVLWAIRSSRPSRGQGWVRIGGRRHLTRESHSRVARCP